MSTADDDENLPAPEDPKLPVHRSPRAVPAHRKGGWVRRISETVGPRLGLVLTGVLDAGMIFGIAWVNGELHHLVEAYAKIEIGSWELTTIEVMTSVGTITLAGGILIHDVYHALNRLWGRE